MNTDPQTPPNANGPHSAGPAEPQSQAAFTHGPRFPSGALRDWLNHRLKVNVPVWAVIVMTVVLLVVALD